MVRTQLVSVSPENRYIIAFCLEDGGLDPSRDGRIRANDAGRLLRASRPTQLDTVTQVHACRAELQGSVRLVIAAATETGVVSLWDGKTGECISLLDEAYGRVGSLKVSTVKWCDVQLLRAVACGKHCACLLSGSPRTVLQAIS